MSLLALLALNLYFGFAVGKDEEGQYLPSIAFVKIVTFKLDCEKFFGCRFLFLGVIL